MEGPFEGSLEQHVATSLVGSEAGTWLTIETPSQSIFSTTNPSKAREHREQHRCWASPSSVTIKSSSLPGVRVGNTTSSTFRLTKPKPSIGEVAEYRSIYLGPKAKELEKIDGRRTPMAPEERRHDRRIAQMRAKLDEDLKWLQQASDAAASAPLGAPPPRRARRRRQSPGVRYRQ